MARFVAKRRNISFEGCAFKNFGYQTEDVDRISRLRKSRFCNNGFIEIERDDVLGESFNKPIGQASVEELKRQIMLRENAETTEFEEVNVQDLDNEIKEVQEYTIEDDYEELKAKAKEKGMVWKGFPKKKDLIEFLNE